MEISFSQLIDIKCILAGKTKKQIASELNISQMTLSREIKDSDILSDLDDFFNAINPEINSICDKLRNNELNVVNDRRAEYNVTDNDKKVISEMNRTIIALQSNLKSMNKIEEILNRENVGLYEKVSKLEFENHQLKKKLGIDVDSKAS